MLDEVTYCTVKRNASTGEFIFDQYGIYPMYMGKTLLTCFYIRRKLTGHYPQRLYELYEEFRSSPLWTKYKEIGSSVSELDADEAYRNLVDDPDDLEDPPSLLVPFLYGYSIGKNYETYGICNPYLGSKYLTRGDVRWVKYLANYLKTFDKVGHAVDPDALSDYPIRWVKMMIRCFVDNDEVRDIVNQKISLDTRLIYDKICEIYAREMYES